MIVLVKLILAFYELGYL